MRVSLAVSSLLLLAAAPAAALPVPDDHGCMGRWVGQGRNTGHASSWTIDLTLTSAPSGGRCGTIEYTNPVCGGTLESCELVGDEIHTRESYTHAEPSCAAAGRVIIRCDGDRMRYSWIGWERVDTILHRPQGAAQAPPDPAQPGGTQPSEPPSTQPVQPPATPPGVQPTQPPSAQPALPGTPPAPIPPSESGGCAALRCDVGRGSAAPALALLGVTVVLLGARRRAR